MKILVKVKLFSYDPDTGLGSMGTGGVLGGGAGQGSELFIQLLRIAHQD